MIDDRRLSRWSRRKVRAKTETVPDTLEEDAAVEAAAVAEAEERYKPGRMITDPSLIHDRQDPAALNNEDDVKTDEATIQQGAAPADENLTDDRLLGEEDFADVDFDALNMDSDYTRFMGKNVPEHIRDRALSKLWVSSPLFAEFDGLNDYDEDFTDAKWVVKNLRTDYKVGRGFQTDEDLAKWEELGAESKKRSDDEQRRKLLARTIKIAIETPDQPQIATFFAASDRYHSNLYPAESNHFVSAPELMTPQVRFLVARDQGVIIGCGALVLGNEGRGELKRMWVDPDARGKGIGGLLVDALEVEARAENVTLLCLETGNKQPDAVGLYRSCGFAECEAFGSYDSDPLSIFMEKKLKAQQE